MLSKLEKWSKIDWLTNVDNLQYEVFEGIDYLALITFVISPSQLDKIIRLTGFSSLLKQNFYPFPANNQDKPVWWTPEESKDFLGGAKMLPGLYRELLIDLASATSYRVYLRTYQIN